MCQSVNINEYICTIQYNLEIKYLNRSNRNLSHTDLSAYRILMFFFIPIYLFKHGKPKNHNHFVKSYSLTRKLGYIYQYFTEMLQFLCALSPGKPT